MPLPLIPVAIALIASAGAGSVAGVLGLNGMKDAKRIRDAAKKTHERTLRDRVHAEALTTEGLESYGRRQIDVQTTTLGGWLFWLEENDRKVRRLHRPSVAGVQVPELDLPELRKLVDEGNLLMGGVASAVSAVVAQQAALGGVRALAAAGTGAAISTLSGAAAESATLAWLGGGTLAAGGGGVAVGGMVLTGVAVAPAVLLGGITLAIQGDQAKTLATTYEAEVGAVAAEIDHQINLMKRLRRRCRQLGSVLDRLDARASESLDILRKLDFDAKSDAHVTAFQQTALLMAELGQVLSAPLLSADGELSPESLTVIERNAE